MISLKEEYPTVYKYILDGYKLRGVRKKDLVGITKLNFEEDEYELALIKEDDWAWYEGNTLSECLQKCEEDLIECETSKLNFYGGN